MSFFSKMFGGSSESKEKKILPWIELNNLELIKEIQEKSKTKAQIVFKHSIRCGISRMVMNQFIDNYDLENTDVDLYYLDIINNREVSNEVGYHFQVIHESPQLLVIKNGVAVAHASHGSINEIELSEFA